MSGMLVYDFLLLEAPFEEIAQCANSYGCSAHRSTAPRRRPDAGALQEGTR
jgi:hypothetical protein